MHSWMHLHSRRTQPPTRSTFAQLNPEAQILFGFHKLQPSGLRLVGTRWLERTRLAPPSLLVREHAWLQLQLALVYESPLLELAQQFEWIQRLHERQRLLGTHQHRQRSVEDNI